MQDDVFALVDKLAGDIISRLKEMRIHPLSIKRVFEVSMNIVIQRIENYMKKSFQESKSVLSENHWLPNQQDTDKILSAAQQCPALMLAYRWIVMEISNLILIKAFDELKNLKEVLETEQMTDIYRDILKQIIDLITLAIKMLTRS